MQNAKCKMQNAKCKMQNAKCKMQNAKGVAVRSSRVNARADIHPVTANHLVLAF
jgi:hypothetical protein